MSSRSASARERWRRVVARQARSRLGPAAFCRREGVPLSSFYAWRRRLRAEAAASSPFVPVKIATPDAPPELHPQSPSASGEPGVEQGIEPGVTVLLGGGRRVAVRRGFDPDLLRQVVAALEAVA